MNAMSGIEMTTEAVSTLLEQERFNPDGVG